MNTFFGRYKRLDQTDPCIQADNHIVNALQYKDSHPDTFHDMDRNHNNLRGLGDKRESNRLKIIFDVKYLQKNPLADMIIIDDETESFIINL